jgi:hypothetical protein
MSKNMYTYDDSICKITSPIFYFLVDTPVQCIWEMKFYAPNII